jgi:hypothetical protein
MLLTGDIVYAIILLPIYIIAGNKLVVEGWRDEERAFPKSIILPQVAPR